MAVSFNLDGQAYTFPDWATEATAEQMLDILKTMAKSAGATDAKAEKTVKASEKLLNEIKKGNTADTKNNEDQKKRDEKQIKASQELGESMDSLKTEFEKFKQEKYSPKGFLDTFADAVESEGEMVGKAMFDFGHKFIKVGAYVSTTIGVAGGFIGNALLGAGNSLNDLAKVGVGFNDTYSGMAKSAGLGVSQLGALTGGFEASAKLIGQYSNVVAVQGFGNFSSSMKFAADTSEELGLSFEDSMEQFGDALARRQGLLNVGNVSQSRMNKQVQTTVKSQMAYATALGVSTDHLQQFVDSLIRDNGLLSASLLSFNDTIRSDVVAGIEVFASGMAAMGGKAGEDIAASFLEAGSAGAIGLSEAATGFVTALPQLAGPVNEFATAMKNGTLSQDQAKEMVNGLTSQLGNLDAGEKARIRQLAIIGDEHAKTLANAITQFEQSEDKLKEINQKFGTAFDMDAVQTGTNQFNKLLTQVSGGFSNAFYSLFADPGVMKVLEEGVKEIFAIFGMGVDDLSGAAMNSADMVKSMLPAIKTFVAGVVDIAKSVAGFFKDAFDEGGIEGVLSALGAKVAGVLFKAAVMFVGVWLAGTMAVHLAKTVLMPKALAFGSQLFSQGAPIAKQLGSKALAYGSQIFSKDGASKIAGSVAGVVQKFGEGVFGKDSMKKLSSFVSDKAQGIASSLQGMANKAGASGKPGGFAAKAADMLKGSSDSADKMTGAISGGGKSSGFLQKIADAVSKFGDNKVVKGAASIALLGASVALAAVGFKTFNEVEWKSLAKGFIAIGSLVAIAKLLEKGTTGMIKGAAAIAILGAATVPLAFGLSLMKDVGFDTILNLGAGLAVLGVSALALGAALPLLAPGAVALAMLGSALIPFGFAMSLIGPAMPAFAQGLEQLSQIDGAGLAGAAGGLLLMSGAMALIVPLIPLMMLAQYAVKPLTEMGAALYIFNGLNTNKLSMIGPAIASIGAGMSALSGGSLMSSVKDGIGSLFGADSPIDKIRNFAQALGEIDVHPLLDVAYGFESLLASSEQLVDFGITLSVITDYTQPFIDQMAGLAGSIESMGDNPFAPFSTLETHSESMITFATSAEQLTNALDAIDGEYVGDQFYAIGDSIQYMVEQLDQLNMGDMVKLGAMKLFGPSKEEKQEAVQQEAITNQAKDKLYGENLMGGGLEDMLVGLTGTDKYAQSLRAQASGVTNANTPAHFLNQQNVAALGQHGINVDMSKIRLDKGATAETQNAEISRISQLVRQQVDAYKMQERTGIDQKAVPTVGQQPQIEEAPTNTGVAQNTLAEFKPESQSMGAELDMPTLLAELVRLQTENNRLLKKEIDSINNLDV